MKTDASEWHLFSYPGYLSEKSLRTAYDLQSKIVFNCLADYNCLKDLKVLKEKFEFADIQVTITI